MKFSEVLSLLKRLKISYKQASVGIGMNKNYISDVVCSKINPSKKSTEKLQEYIRQELRKQYSEEENKFLYDALFMRTEFMIPHNNEWQKLKQTELYKQVIINN
jgi:transcriptional regulator with XRE-family HTH domain